MALQDQIIKRLRDRGIEVVDLRGVLPRKGRWLGRPVSAIKQIAGHWDAEHRPHAYDSVQRYIGQAWYHINKDWAPPQRIGGDGFMYAWKIDNVGVVFITRDLEDVLWSVGDQNYVTASYCFDGTTGEGCTREMIASEQVLLEVLCYNTPEIPAGQANALGHQEVPGNSTACPGAFLASIRSYRAERNTHPERYAYENQQPVPPAVPAPAPAPVPSPPPVAAPTPVPPVVVPEPLPEPPAPQAPLPGTIIQPDPGKGSGQSGTDTPNPSPTGQTNADTLPISTPPVATPAPNPTVLPDIPFTYPAPPVSRVGWEPFPEGERVVFSNVAVRPLLLTDRTQAQYRGPFPAGTPLVVVGILTDTLDQRWYVGAGNYGVLAEEIEGNDVPEPALPTPPSDKFGEFVRAIAKLLRGIAGIFKFKRSKK